MEQDIPDYDMDSEDELWIKAQSKKLELTPLKVCSKISVEICLLCLYGTNFVILLLTV